MPRPSSAARRCAPRAARRAPTRRRRAARRASSTRTRTCTSTARTCCATSSATPRPSPTTGARPSLDPSLPALDAARDVARKHARAADLVARRGEVKPKKLRQLAELAKGAAAPSGLKLAPLAELALGPNAGKAVALAVVLPVQKGGETPPDSFLLVGAGLAAGGGEAPLGCVGLSLYNTDTARLSERSVVIVVEPTLVEIAALDKPSDEPRPAARARRRARGPVRRVPHHRAMDPSKVIVDGRALRPIQQNALQLKNQEN